MLSNWNNQAVLDRETGLVWERSPLAPCTNPLFCVVIDNGGRNWSDAQLHCNNIVAVGNRRGWRLPTVQELASLGDADPANTSSPRLPPGSPFTAIQSGIYWWATTDADNTAAAWFVDFFSGLSGRNDSKVGGLHFVWCVRGGQGVDLQ